MSRLIDIIFGILLGLIISEYLPIKFAIFGVAIYFIYYNPLKIKIFDSMVNVIYGLIDVVDYKLSKYVWYCFIKHLYKSR